MRHKVKHTIVIAKRVGSQQSFRRYLFVGVSTVLTDYVLLALFRIVLDKNLFIAVTLSYWISIAYNFSLNRWWSFEAAEGLVRKQLILYLCLLVFNYLITLLIVKTLYYFGISEFIAKLGALCLTVPWTYFAYKKIVFLKENEL
jgi:putative flippase GtrA